MFISPSVHLPQILIFPNRQFAPSPHLFRCPFAPSAYLLFIRCPHASVLICPKCPFVPSVGLLQILHILKYPFASVPTCYSAYHFPKSPFAPMPICPKCPFVPSTQLSETQMYGHQLFRTIYSCAHWSRTQMCGPQLSKTHLLGAHLSWYTFVLVSTCPGPICPGPKCPKTACYTPHLHLLASKLLQKYLAVAGWRNLNYYYYWHIYPPITRKRLSAIRARLEVAGHLSTTLRWRNPVKCLSQRHNK